MLVSILIPCYNAERWVAELGREDRLGLSLIQADGKHLSALFAPIRDGLMG